MFTNAVNKPSERNDGEAQKTFNAVNYGLCVKVKEIELVEGDMVRFKAISLAESPLAKEGQDVTILMSKRRFEASLGHKMDQNIKKIAGLGDADGKNVFKADRYAGTEIIMANCYADPQQTDVILSKSGYVSMHVENGETTRDFAVAPSQYCSGVRFYLNEQNQETGKYVADNSFLMAKVSPNEDGTPFVVIRDHDDGGKLKQIDVETLGRVLGEKSEAMNESIALKQKGALLPLLSATIDFYLVDQAVAFDGKAPFDEVTGQIVEAALQSKRVMLRSADSEKTMEFFLSAPVEGSKNFDRATADYAKSVDKVKAFANENAQFEMIPVNSMRIDNAEAIKLANSYSQYLVTYNQERDFKKDWEFQKTLEAFIPEIGNSKPSGKFSQVHTVWTENKVKNGEGDITGYMVAKKFIAATNSSFQTLPSLNFQDLNNPKAVIDAAKPDPKVLAKSASGPSM